MRNLKRLSIEIQVLQKIYGYQNVAFSKKGEWIFIKNFKLPNGKYNMNSCSVLIIVPENFDDAEVTECYVDKNLKWKAGLLNKNLPHSYKDKSPYKDYQWICFDPTPGNPSNSGLLDFINTLRTYFTDPWKYQDL